jgi:proto-chlorophyllide reductase subunit
MKFLCVPCDSPMKLQTVAPPDRGSLSIVYACPECGYEIAMLTNAYETQAVQSLGVKIGPDRLRAEDGSASRAESATTEGKCPFGAMIPTAEHTDHAENGVRWTPAAEARLANIPEFVRPMAKTGIERYAREQGAVEIDEKILDAAREFFGM